MKNRLPRRTDGDMEIAEEKKPGMGDQHLFPLPENIVSQNTLASPRHEHDIFESAKFSSF